MHPIVQNAEDKNIFTTNLADYGYDTPEFFMGRSVSTGDTDGAQKSAIWAAGVVLFTMVRMNRFCILPLHMMGC